MNNFKTAFLHGLNVAGHILFSAIIVGLAVVINNDPSVTQQFAAFLLMFGIPAAIVNIAIATLVKFIETESAKANETPTTPPTV